MLKFFIAFVVANILSLFMDLSDSEVLIATFVLATYYEILYLREGGDKR